MEIVVRGSIMVPARVVNLGDLLNAGRGLFGEALVRSADLPRVLVAPATTCFALPSAVVKQLKLRRLVTRKARVSGGHTFFGVYEPVKLIVMERECSVDVVKVPDGCPPLLGRLPLRLLDLVIDEANACLVGNPDHGGEPMVDVM